MSSALEMSLDDIIKSNKKSSFRGKGGRGSGHGPARHIFKRGPNRTAPYSKPVQAQVATWQHDMFVDGALAYASQSALSSSIETGTKLYISNLDYGVSNEDIKELFSEIGDLKRYSVHFDKSGRSKGTAEVVFTRRVDAMAAVKRYNNVQLDGKPMKVEIVGKNIATLAVPPTTNCMYGNQNGTSRSRLRRGRAIGRPHRGGRGGRGDRGRVRGRGGKTNLSLEDLDADLEKYHEEAKQADEMVH